MRTIAIHIMLCAGLAATAFAQQEENSPSASHRDPAAHRLFYAPTANTPDGAIVYLLAGVTATFPVSENVFFITPIFCAGTFALDGLIYAEVSTYTSMDVMHYRQDFPMVYKVQVNPVHLSNINLGAGYHFYERRYSFSRMGVRYEDFYNPISWVYASFTWNAGPYTIVVNPGLALQKHDTPSPAGTIGASFDIGDNWRFITDLGFLDNKEPRYDWMWFGFRKSLGITTLDMALSEMLDLYLSLSVTI